MEDILSLIGRKNSLFEKDIEDRNEEILNIISSSSFLIIGAAGSIGQAVTKEIFKRNPLKLHCVDISENNLVELVRDIRSSFGYIEGDFKTFALDVGSVEFNSFLEANHDYDYILNLSALKHVRSERDPYTLFRMVEVNILNTVKTIEFFKELNVKKYFCVSTDKAANPVNMMGASKRIMEMFLAEFSEEINISTARFANVAFSDGSLLDGFINRIEKKQPIAAPSDIKRYFVTPQESGKLCLMSCLFGEKGDIFFPKLREDLNLLKFSQIAENFLFSRGYTPYLCESEQEAREKIDSLLPIKKWPCFFSSSDTTGEKEVEEFFTKEESLNLERFEDIGVVKNEHKVDRMVLKKFRDRMLELRSKKEINKVKIVELFEECLPGFVHNEKSKFLDDKM